MSEQKEKYFQRQHSRFMKAPARKELYQSAEIKNTTNDPQPKEETVTQSFAVKPTQPVSEEKTPFSLTSSAQDALRRVAAAPKGDFESLIKDKILRQDLKKQERRLAKARNDAKLTVQPDTELSITALSSLLGLAEEYVNDVNKQKGQKIAPKTTLRLNQQKEIMRQLTTIDEQIQLNNFAAVKSTIQILLKKYAKDELLQEKLGYLNYILALNEEHEREAGLFRDLSLYVERLSSIDLAPEGINQSNLSLKNLKKETTISLNKENKKQQPNERVVKMITDVDKVGALLSGYVQSKVEKKVGEAKTKREIQLEKELQERLRSSEFLEESSRYCKDLLEKTAESKEELFKQLEALKKNKKKSAQAPYSLILRVYETMVSQKRQVNQINLYLKACSQFYIRKTLNAQNLAVQLKKIDEKYAPNQTLGVVKPNIDVLVNNVQQRERFTKQVSPIETQLKKVKAENLRLQKLLSQSKAAQLPAQPEKTDKRKELQQKRARDAQRMKQEREQKQIERSVDNIFNNLQEKKWKVARNTINVFLKRHEESTSPLAVKSLQALNTISVVMQDLENAQARALQAEKREKAGITALQKERQALNERIKSSQDYEGAIKNLIQTYSQEGFVVRKFFDDVRRDRKKIVQERYQLLMKLQDPLTVSRQAKLSEVSQKVSLSLSESNESELQRVRKEMEEMAANLDKEKERSFMLESKLKESKKAPEVNKDAQQLLNLAKRIEKGGEWWKFLPKNLKSSTFKHIYSILQKYRENELTIQSLQMFMVNEQLLREQAATMSNAFDSALSLIKPEKDFYQQQFWTKSLSNYKGNQHCDKFINCLNEISRLTRQKIEEQRSNYKSEVAGYVLEIQNLSSAINDLQKRKDTHTEKSSSKFQESSSKKSPELKTSRRVSRSKQKEKQGQVMSQAMQEYVQQERKMLSKIQQLQSDKQNLQARAAAIENQLIQAERRLDDQRVDYENARFAAQRLRLQQLEKTNELEGELEISEGRRIQLQTALETDRSAFSQLEKQLLSKLQEFQSRQAIHLQQLKGRPQQSASQAEQRLTSQLNYYREMYGELSRELQVSKEREQQLLNDSQSLRRNIDILERKYEADVGLGQTATHDPAENSNPQSSAEEVGSPLKLRAHKVELKTEKIFDLYLDWEPTRKRDRANEGTPERVKIEGSTSQPSQVDELRQVIAGLQVEMRALHEQRAQDTERQVVLALKRQEDDFNQFLKGLVAEKQAYLLNEVLPARLQQELALRPQQASAAVPSNSYEFLHNEWIENEFPRLYDERHKRQCLSATADVESMVSRRVQEAKEELARQDGTSQQGVNQRIERSLMQFQQKTLPLIISQHQQQWQEAKAVEWQIKTRQIQDYWVGILEEQKQLARTNSAIQQSPERATESEEVHRVIWRQPTEIELFQTMRREGNRHILGILLGEELERWEHRKADEWVAERNRLQAYWQNVVLPEKCQQWEAAKEKEIAQLRLSLQQESETRLGERLSQVLSAHKQTKVQQIHPSPQALVPLNEQEIIQRWKALNLPLVVQSQRRFAIQQFIAVDLPHILQQERTLWTATRSASPLPPSPADIDSLLILERQRWQEEKAKEIAFMHSAFEARLNDILIAEHAEWEKSKALQMQASLPGNQLPSLSPAPADIEQVLQRQHAHWQLVKLQQIRSLQLQFETRLNEIERKLNSQIIDYQQKFLREQNRMAEVEAAAVTRWRNSQLPLIIARERESSVAQFRSKELPRILEEKYRDWETVDLIQLIHTESNSYIVDHIVSQHRKEWEQETVRQKAEYEGKIKEARGAFDDELIKLRQEQERVEASPNGPRIDMGEWQRAKNAEIQLRIKQVEHYWQTVILPSREDAWRKDQIPIVQSLLSTKIAQVQGAYQQNYIPNIIQQQRKKWQHEYQEGLARERQQWAGELPSLLKPGGQYSHLLQSSLQSQAVEYQLQVKKIEAESVGSAIKIQQLANQLAHYEQLLRENQTRYETSESKVRTLLNEQDITVKRTLQESQRLNEELTRSRWAEREVEDLRKIIEMQKGEIAKLTTSLGEGEGLRLENISLQEANSSLQKMKLQQINDLRTNYQTKLIELSSERNVLQSKVCQLQGRNDPADRQALLSYQRQIGILSSTIKTKDTEIGFLKKTIESANNELRQNRQKLNEQLQKRGSCERGLAELKNVRLQLDYQIKYLKDRQESLSKKLQLKDQQMLALRKKIDLDNDSIEKKLKSSLEYAASYQLKFSQLESMLTYKTKEGQALLVQADRLRYENQGLTANLQSLTTDAELYKRQVREAQAQKIALSAQRDRSLDETSRLKQLMVQYEQQIKRGAEHMNRMTVQFNTEKTRLQGELKRNREEILHLQIELKDTERIKRIEMDRANKLQREIAENSREAELGEIQVLKKINRDVSELTAANRQLEMKCLLLQNKERITPSASESINSYLLTQKYTDQLLEYLLKEGIVPNLELYHRFLAESRTVLAGGRGQEYYQVWQKMLRGLFHLTISCRSQQIRTQAQELLRLRDEMTQVLERQIEASEGDQDQLVQDYRQVLNDVKSLVREYMRTGDEEYLRLLCASLAIAA